MGIGDQDLGNRRWTTFDTGTQKMKGAGMKGACIVGVKVRGEMGPEEEFEMI